jgi:Mrp family chromosome partitioning ATPase
MELESTFPAMRPPSDEQQAIVAQLQDPPDARARIVCVTVGAGVGKTTTLLHLAKEYDRLGHMHGTYLTFNRAAAEDTKRRITEVLPGFQLDARTIHPASRAALALHRQALEVNEKEASSWDDVNDLQKTIARLLQEDIAKFVRDFYKDNHKGSGTANDAKENRRTRAKKAGSLLYLQDTAVLL